MNLGYRDSFIPLADRIPVTTDYIKEHYWINQETTFEIAQNLNVPEEWVIKEIKRLNLGKKENNIKHKGGRKNHIMSEEEKKKRENQPHSKPIVRICPKTFTILGTYSSISSVERYGYRRENVRKAIRTGGLHKNFLWAKEGFHEPIIKVVKQRGNLEKKLQISDYKRPDKKQLERFYIKNNFTLEECAKRFKCHKVTIAILVAKYNLKKRTKEIDIEELKELYVTKGLKAKDIAVMLGYTTSTIATYLSRNKIKKKEM